MFDPDLPRLDLIRGLPDAGLVDVMADGVRLQSAWLARVFAAGAELCHRRLRDQDVARREIWAVDGWAAVAAEIAAAQGISRGRAAGQLRIGLALADRLPRFGALFAAGPNGWRDRQESDGTVIWSSPTGHTYVTKPAGALFFPQLARPTGELALPQWSPQGDRSLMMPTRVRTRAQDRADRIRRERNHNQARLDAQAAAAAKRRAARDDPPPF